MNIFTYGSLIFPEVLDALTERYFEHEDITVPGFERRTLIGKPYPGVIRNDGTSVEGRLWFDLDRDSVEILDRFEDTDYERRSIEIETRTRGRVNASMYIIPDSLKQTLSDEPWDKEHFMREHLAEYVSMCRAFRNEVSQHFRAR